MRLPYVTKLAPTYNEENLLVMNMCGRGDKDIFAVGIIRDGNVVGGTSYMLLMLVKCGKIVAE